MQAHRAQASLSQNPGATAHEAAKRARWVEALFGRGIVTPSLRAVRNNGAQSAGGVSKGPLSAKRWRDSLRSRRQPDRAFLKAFDRALFPLVS
jgi:hypothetical protein